MRVATRLGRVRRNLLWAGSNGGELGRTALVLVLCGLMVDQPMFAAPANANKRGPTAAAQAKGEDRILHALNRLTFGPRPGDVAAVQQIGLTNWFEMQLNPSKIDDSALDGRLAQFPAMQLPQQELMERYPSQQIIRQMAMAQQRPFAQRYAAMYVPNDPVEKAIYADEMAFYRLQQQNKATKDAVANAGQDGMTPGAAPVVRKKAAQAQSADTSADMNASAAAAQAPAGGEQTASAGGDMTAAVPDYDAMASGKDAGPVSEMTVLPKDQIVDSQQPPDSHVEKLFRDLDAVSIINLPPDQRIKKVLAMAPNDFVAFRQSLSGVELVQFAQGLSPQQREIFAAMQNSTRLVGSEEMQERLIRDIYSDRQLEAVMTDFWLNHFNVYIRKNANEPYLIPAYERDVIRPHALGKFEDLLVATAESPAMLMYLDNWQSIGPDSAAAKGGPAMQQRPFFRGRFPVGPMAPVNPQAKAAQKDRGLNENYGRELMELHTLGVNGGYTQQDVTEVSKVFTGWTINQPFRGGEFQFDERRHEPGSKTVLGKTIKENGMKEGLEVLHMLATSPSTAKFISTKLAVRFVSDDPPQALVDRMSQAFLSTQGDIKAVLRTMFESPEFWAPAAQRSKVKTPEELVVSAVRASGANVNNAQALVLALDRLGMPLYGMQTPNGYSWKSDPWVSTGELVSRMNFALVLTGDKLPGVRTDWTKLLSGDETRATPVSMEANDSASGYVDPEAAAKEKKLELILLGQPLSDKSRNAVLQHSNDSTAAVQAVRDFQGGGGGKGALFGAGPLGYGDGYGQPLRNIGPDDRQAAVMAGLMLGSPEFQRR